MMSSTRLRNCKTRSYICLKPRFEPRRVLPTTRTRSGTTDSPLALALDLRNEETRADGDTGGEIHELPDRDTGEGLTNRQRKVL